MSIFIELNFNENPINSDDALVVAVTSKGAWYLLMWL
jgi:hypothetical protein